MHRSELPSHWQTRHSLVRFEEKLKQKKSPSRSYKLKFLPSALKEWKKIGPMIREQLKKKLQERLDEPEVPADRLHGF